ncbi:MAG: HAMP domain-containing histidine kinase [Lachnospiraceae bacterium]|nr:HAMP domain-containing histidine kinase [Lachnospiraceae bacterium]
MKYRRTLYLKFILAYLAFGLISFFLITTLFSRLTFNHLVVDKAAALYKEATLISTRYADSFYDSSLQADDVKDQLEAIDTFTQSAIWIINPDGELLYNSTDTSVDEDNTVVIEHFDPTDTGSNYYMVGDFYGNFEDDVLSVFSPINSDFRIRGYVVMHYEIDDLKDTRDSLLNIYYMALGIMFVLSLFILGVFTVVVYRPLKKITKATEEYADGNLTHQIEINKDDEIGHLAASLNYMASELSKGEDNQKQFIANVSHDFRSPLTSIKGYIEAMADGTIPPEMSGKYLNIVLNETERLTKLTNSLLSLNNLNTKGMHLDISDFDINAVIKNTAATFEGTCKQKRIRFKLVLCGENLFVTADMGRIQQVLYNLIDNAIKFSDYNSEIKLETSEKNDTVFVSVKDSGIGIPKESQKLVFDRFYKTDLSRGKDKKGTGLGLAITKEIINAHHENINVISTVGVGTEFIFTLPKSKEEESI